MDGAVVINVDLNTKSFDAQIEELEDKLDTLVQEYEAAIKNGDFPEDELIKYRAEIERTTNKISNLKTKQDELNAPPTNLRDFFADMGNNLSVNIKKVKRLVLGIFGIRGAYMAIRNAMNIITQDDEQLKADIDYIKAVLAYALEPIVRGIVDLVKTIVAYIGYIAQAWFKVNIFEKAHNKMLKQGVGYAKEMRRQLAGFDEMNVLQSDTSGGGTSGATPDFSAFENPEIPYWIDWIAHNKDIVLGFLAGIAGIIASMKLAKLLSIISKIFQFLTKIPKLGLLGVILGIATAISGIVDTVKAITRYIAEPTWEHFDDILKGISVTIAGIGIALVALNATNPIGWIVIATGLLIDNIRNFSELIRVMVEGKAQIMSVKDAQDALNQSRLEAISAEKQYRQALDNKAQAEEKLKQLEEQLRISGEQLYQEVNNGKRAYEQLTPELRDLYWAYLDMDEAEERVKVTSEKFTEAKKKEKEMSWENQLALAQESGDYEEFRDAVVKAYEDGGLEADEARTLIERAMSKIDSKTDETFTRNLPNKIREGLNPDRYRSSAWDVVNVINDILSHVSPAIGLGFQGLTSGIRHLFGFAKGGIVVPRLASGGIINQPGRGVPIASAVGGERGMEGVIPLTDSQQMALLGEAIGRYVTINANIVNEMNGRVISRELKQVQNNSDFAYNR